MNNDYLDIIDLPRPEPKHPRMSIYQRAAQFSPFAALRGYEDALSEEERITFHRVELSDDEKKEINEKLCTLIKEKRNTRITYFQGEETGEYITIEGYIKKISETTLMLENNLKIAIKDIVSIENQ